MVSGNVVVGVDEVVKLELEVVAWSSLVNCQFCCVRKNVRLQIWKWETGEGSERWRFNNIRWSHTCCLIGPIACPRVSSFLSGTRGREWRQQTCKLTVRHTRNALRVCRSAVVFSGQLTRCFFLFSFFLCDPLFPIMHWAVLFNVIHRNTKLNSDFFHLFSCYCYYY